MRTPAAASPRVSRRPSRRGSVIVAIVMALVILQIVVIGVVTMGARYQDLSVRRLESARAVYAAEGGANMALREIRDNVDEDGDGAIGSIAGGVPASGWLIGVGGTRAAVASVNAGASYMLTATGTSGLAMKNFRIGASRPIGATTTVAGAYVECWNLATAPSSVGGIGAWSTTPGWTTVMPNPNLNAGSGARWPGGGTRFALRATGKITIPTAGNWSFYTASDDGSIVWINGTKVVDNDGNHSVRTRSGTINLPAGGANFEIKFYDQGGSSQLEVYWSGPGVGAQTIIPDSAYTCAPPAQPSIAADAGISIAGDSGATAGYIDAYNSNNGSYSSGAVLRNHALVQVNSTSASAFTVSNSASVMENALCGPGGTPGTVVTTSSGGSVTGSSAVAASRVALLPPYRPSGLPGLSGALTRSSGTIVISSNQHYSAMSLSGKAAVQVSGNITIVCDGDLAMSNSSRIDVLNGSSLTLFLYGNLTLTDTAKVNYNTNPAGGRIPTRCLIHMPGSGKNVSMGTNSCKLVACVRDPGGGLSVTGSGATIPEFFGTFHGLTVATTLRARIHADTARCNIGGVPLPVANIAISDWAQVP